jgi:methylmalonyl-CoA mutase
MVKLQDKLRFQDDFPPVKTEEWEEKIKKDLKGADYEKKLIQRTLEGFNIRPYYRAEDLKNIKHLNIAPGAYPWVRGKKSESNSWFIRQDINIAGEYEKANKKILELLNRGVDSPGLVFNDQHLPDKKQFEKLLKDICLPAIELNCKTGHAASDILDLIQHKINADSIDKNTIRGGIDYNPLGCLNIRGNFCYPRDKVFSEMKALVNQAADLPHFTVVEVNAATIHKAGSSIVQELAFALAMGNEYLSNLTDRGIKPEDAARKIQFKFGVGPAYFLEIAKFRAARMLWAEIVSAYNPADLESAQMKIHAETSCWNHTIYDPYVNMLRNTTEAMSASLGGADTITVTPYNSAFEKPGEFAERNARNTQIILKEEAHFDKVVDPAGGAYYIEQLTQSIADHTWKLFQKTENEGGYIEAFKKGMVQEKIKEVASKRNLNLALRKEALVGINLYPNANEMMEQGYDESVIQSRSQKTSDALAEPITPYRGAEEIETLRFKTDKHQGKHPRVFMLTIGDAKMRRARAQFSAGFFAAAGFEIIDNIGFNSVEEGIQEARNKKADIVVICSSDPEYPQFAPIIHNALKDEAIIVIAGYPKESIEELKNKGIQHFIHTKSNLVETLKMFQKELGIE